MLWIYRLIFTPFPLQEVMTLAWHGHYATSQAKVQSPELMLAQNRSQRELWRAPIGQLHRRMLGDGAMRRWLDGLDSTKAQPNENLAREFLELFALGVGHYTERDVREAARALTGWRESDFRQHNDQFDPGDFDDGHQDDPGRDRPLGPRRPGADRLPAERGRRTTSPAGSTGRSSPTPTSPRPS